MNLKKAHVIVDDDLNANRAKTTSELLKKVIVFDVFHCCYEGQGKLCDRKCVHVPEIRHKCFFIDVCKNVKFFFVVHCDI